jgi:hypothetical protein
MILLFCFLTLNLSLWGEEGLGIRGLIEWDRMEMSVVVSLDMAKAGFRLPSDRARAEARLEDEYPGLVRPLIFGIQADSSATVEDLINRGELPLHRADQLAGAARRIPPSLSTDLSAISGRYTLNLNSVAAAFIHHSRPQDIHSPLLPSPAQAYTGIIIIADETLPVHGRQTPALAKPCLFPKIWDTRMNLIYERNAVDPELGSANGLVRYSSREAIMRSTPSGIDPSLIPLVGENPLRIMARGIFGVQPTDPVIDGEDAGLILAIEANRRLLREGRVVIILHKDQLKSTL